MCYIVIMKHYKEWASDDVKNKALVAYVSMHNSSKVSAERLKASLEKQGVEVSMHNLTSADLGELAMDLIDSATIALCAPTVLAGIHPTAAYAAYLVNALRPKAKYLAFISSYSWAEMAAKEVLKLMDSFKGEIFEPVKIAGLADEKGLAEIDALAAAITEKHKF